MSAKCTLYSNFEELPTLYKMDSKGKIRQWTIFCSEHTTYSLYEQEHGLKDGKLQTTSTEFKTGKNIGKVNETTHWEQCLAEAQSLWTKKKEREGYSETIPTDRPCLPMLAKVYKDHKKKVKFPCYVDAKVDGCVSGDTLIKTKEFGYRTIKWIVNNKTPCKVLSMNPKTKKNEYKKILNYFVDRDLGDETVKWYEIETESGEKLKVTGNHKIYIPGLDCWRRVDELTGNENLMLI